jgi:hypothetical protein
MRKIYNVVIVRYFAAVYYMYAYLIQHFVRVRRGSVAGESACCKAGPSLILGSAPHGGSSLAERRSDDVTTSIGRHAERTGNPLLFVNRLIIEAFQRISYPVSRAYTMQNSEV